MSVVIEPIVTQTIIEVDGDNVDVIEVGGGAITFLGLVDSPSAYTGQATRFVRVKADETGVEFVPVAPGGGTIDAWADKGTIDPAANPNYPAAVKGDLYRIITAVGKIGGVNGVTVLPGDIIVCLADAGAGDHATVGASWFIGRTSGRLYRAAGAPAYTPTVALLHQDTNNGQMYAYNPTEPAWHKFMLEY